MAYSAGRLVRQFTELRQCCCQKVYRAAVMLDKGLLSMHTMCSCVFGCLCHPKIVCCSAGRLVRQFTELRQCCCREVYRAAVMLDQGLLSMHTECCCVFGCFCHPKIVLCCTAGRLVRQFTQLLLSHRVVAAVDRHPGQGQTELRVCF